tara:strand:+ start:326 stop:1003 length:678 start_codon:yes stop_codon:yes gene_type:complete
MATYLQFAGRHQNAITTTMSGHKSFGTWNVAGAVYEESTTLTINTPNYGPSDGLPCGSWINTTTNANRGFAAYSDVGSISGGDQQLISIGCLNLEEYTTANGVDWTPYTDEPNGFYTYDGVTNSAYPGNAAQDGAYTLIFLSNVYRGESTLAKTLSRVIYKAAVGTLGAVATRLVTTGGSGGGAAAPTQWAVTAASSDEQAVGSLLASGYGVLLDGDLINSVAND